MNIFKLRLCLPLMLGALVAGCGGEAVKPAAPPPVVQSPPPKITVGLALGGGAAKGFAHIGVIKMLEANGASRLMWWPAPVLVAWSARCMPAV